MENIGCSSRKMKSSKSKAKKKDEDFEEEEVWQNWSDLVKAEKEVVVQHSNNLRPRKSILPSCVSRMNLSKVNNNNNISQPSSSSGPMNIPDWSKIKDDDGNNDDDCGGYDDDEMIPPHEIVARRKARSHVVSYSMCEGVGRTLKGRDLSKLRNSILTKTGFLE